MKKLLLLFYATLVGAICANSVYAQTLKLSASPTEACLGSNVVAFVVFEPNDNVPYDKIEFDMNSDGTPEQNSPNKTFQYGYTSPGSYTITATAVMLDGTRIKSNTFVVSIATPPTANFDVIGNDIQCFRGNRYEFKNTSVAGSKNITRLTYVFGDGERQTVINPVSGSSIFHSYEFGGTFDVTMEVMDENGCISSIPAPKSVIVKENLDVKFDALGQRECFGSTWVLRNYTAGIDFKNVRKYTWDFGDGTSLTKEIPFSLPQDSLDFASIAHFYNYVIVNGKKTGGRFFPALVIEDKDNCIDSIRLRDLDNVPENFYFEFDVIPTITGNDTTLRADSVCYGTPHESKIYFRQTPIALTGPGEFLWNFGDPNSMQLNFNNSSWWPMHEFTTVCDFDVTLTHLPCSVSTTVPVRVLGPLAKIEDPMKQIVIDPSQKTQCSLTGTLNTVEFPNTSQYCYSEHMWRQWDFGDEVAPRCTSFLVPNSNFPPAGGWNYQNFPPFQQHTNSVGYFIQNGIVYPGKRTDCNYSHDTLPIHTYTDWGKVYEWYRDGHDFMPWDLNRYTRNPADTSGPNRKFWVPDRDTVYWGKAVYLNPETGARSVTQGTYEDPIFGTVLWPRIDTIGESDPATQFPQDLEPFNRITMNRGTPDPFEMEKGIYNVTPRGMLADPKNQPLGFRYAAAGKIYQYSYDKLLPNSAMTLYEYIFYREVQKCNTVKLTLADSLNNGSDIPPTVTDYMVLDPDDCGHDAQVQLALVRPDARGLGKGGKECSGRYNPDGNGIRFHLDPSIYVNPFTGQAFEYPGINPTCGQSFIEINIDSMADRLDQTPCNLDGFTTWEGGTTPGGLIRPVFTNAPDWSNPMQFWQDPGGTSTWYHYGPPSSIGGQNTPAPADPRGFVTVGLRVGTGDINGAPACISETVWYHNFLYFRTLDAQFYLDPVYDPTTGLPSTPQCRQYCKNETILFVYADSTQDSVGLSLIDWGDNTYTIDSFFYSDGRDDGFFVKGQRRVRYEVSLGTCREFAESPIILSVTEFPNGLPGTNQTVVWHENYKRRLYDAMTNPNGSLVILGENPTADSLLISECGNQYWLAKSDTLEYWYYPEVQDWAMMLLPVPHQYTTSSFENGCKQSGIAPTRVNHIITSVKGCISTASSRVLPRGVIDTAMVMNEKMEFDTVFCIGEPVHFYDSVRYWRPDCAISDPVFNPNRDWGWSGDPFPQTDPVAGYHFDTTDYWKRETGNPNFSTNDPLYPYVEKMYWDFGDGNTATGVRPVHRYKNPGRYVVTMRTIDRRGCADTSWCYVYVSDPVSKPQVKPGFFNCGADVTLYDRSFMSIVDGNDNSDSIKNNYWWFGERKTADTLTRFDAFNDDTAIWNYRKNGYFDVKLVVETYQGCKDTMFEKVFVSGPRPKIGILTDTIGCSPLRVGVVNLADTDNPDPSQKLTRVSVINWGDGTFSQNIIAQYDTIYYTYYDTGVYYISVNGDDNNPMDNNSGCKIITFPDTTDNFEQPIRITVKHSYPAEIDVDPQTVCVDQGFTITNKSDTTSYIEYKYSIVTADTTTEVESFTGTNAQLSYTRSIDSIGRYLVLLEPTKFVPGIPECKLYDTVVVNVVKPTAGIVIDSTSIQDRKESQFIFNVDTNVVRHPENKDFIYDWIVYKVNEENNPFKQVQDLPWANRDLGLIDFGNDTGTYVVCLSTYTLDPAKPICADTICDTVEFKFVIKMEIFNVFTPDGDRTNDVFDIDIEGEEEYDLVIYNRWGTKVFESKEDGEKGDTNKNWNGKNMNTGADCPAGTYFYVFKYRLRTGVEETLNGTITLIR